VVWTVGGAANLDATGGQPLARRPSSVVAGAPVTDVTSAGIAIAEMAARSGGSQAPPYATLTTNYRD
jgi:hypothetical protein